MIARQPPQESKQPSSTKRAGLIAWQHDIVKKYISLGYEGLAEMCKQTADMLEADAQEIKELKALSVTNLLIDVVPGDGYSHEIYAKSVTDVERMLTKLDSELEGAQSECHNLRDKLKAQQVVVPANNRNPMTECEILHADPCPHEMFDQQRIAFARAVEAHHGITPQPPQGDKT